MIDVHSLTWEGVNARCRVIMADARAKLEKPGLAAAETEFERGRLFAARQILSLAEPKLTPTNDSVESSSLY